MTTQVKKLLFAALIQEIRTSPAHNVYIASAAGYGNLGDDLLLQYLYRTLSPYKMVRYLTYRLHEDSRIEEHVRRNLKVPIESDFARVDAQSSTLLIGGGTLFNLDVFPDEPFLHIGKLAIDSGCTVSLLGVEIVNIGNVGLARAVFSSADLIGIRNIESRAAISSIFGPHEIQPSASVVGDIAEHIDLVKGRTRTAKTIGVCIAPKAQISARELNDEINLLVASGYAVELFSFCNHITAWLENDLMFARSNKQSLFACNPSVTVFAESDMSNVVDRLVVLQT